MACCSNEFPICRIDAEIKFLYRCPMIVEQLPEVQSLSSENKLALAVELFEGVTDCSVENPDLEIVRILDERLAEHREQPSAASPWSEVKARILGSRDS